MLKIYPKFTPSEKINNSSQNNKDIPAPLLKVNYDNFVKAPTNVNFGQYFPSKTNAQPIREIFNFIKKLVSKLAKFAILYHSGPDGDAILSGLTLQRYLKKAFNIKADIIVMNPVPKNFKPFYKKKDIKVVSKILGKKASAEAIKKHFGTYKAVFCLDTARTDLFDNEIYEGIVAPAENIVKIDHHNVDPDKLKDYNYGHINLVDPTKKAVGQLLMEFVDVLGLDKKRSWFKKISDLIAGSISSDTNLLQHDRVDSEVLRDIEVLNRTSNISRIIQLLKRQTPKETKAIRTIKKNIKFINTSNEKIAYSTFDATGTNFSDEEVKKVTGIVVDEMVPSHNLNFAFLVKKYPDGRVSASVRSDKDNSAFEIARKLGGGGHQNSSGIDFYNNETIEEAVNLILKQFGISKPPVRTSHSFKPYRPKTIYGEAV